MELISVKTPGGYTTVQDRGRFGFQQMGVPVSGALDHFARRVANLLVGNSENAAVLELTVMGPVLEFLTEADVALTGARMGMTLNDSPVPGWTSIRLASGDILAIHQVESGCRSYVAVSGGIEVPEIMGSRSTYVGGKLGGFHGRPLNAGDVLQGSEGPLLQQPRALDDNQIPEHPDKISLRAVSGPQQDFFHSGLPTFFESEYMVTPKADRMGYRLQGPAVPIDTGKSKSIVSEPSMPGSVQIPADEQPIILLVEQTVGGYCKAATVISSDLPKVAQATPGDRIRFEQVDLETAHRLHGEYQERLRKIAESLSTQ